MNRFFVRKTRIKALLKSKTGHFGINKKIVSASY